MAEGKKADRAVLKVGGARLEDSTFVGDLAREVEARTRDSKLVLVHGGGPQIASLHRDLGIATSKIDGVRVTREDSIPVVAMALARVNLWLVSALGRAGVRALGVSGVDTRFMRSSLRGAAIWGRVGHSPEIQRSVLNRLLEDVDCLVVSPICLGPDHEPVNVNADDVATAVARALGASRLDLLTDVDAVQDGTGRALRELRPEQVEELISSGEATGGMVAKLRAATELVQSGDVGRVVIGTLESAGEGRATSVIAGANRRRITKPAARATA